MKIRQVFNKEMQINFVFQQVIHYLLKAWATATNLNLNQWFTENTVQFTIILKLHQDIMQDISSGSFIWITPLQ